MNNIKKYCKYHKLRFEYNNDKGFIASKIIPIRAGIEIDIHTGKIISLPIKTIAKQRIFRSFLTYNDGDIVDNGKTTFASPLPMRYNSYNTMLISS
jgi:hypothetical protein